MLQWETYKLQTPLTRALESAYLPAKSNTTQIPAVIPDWYSLHYLTLCSGTFIWETDTSVTPPSTIKYKNTTSAYCTPRWLDQRANLSQILIFAAIKRLSDPRAFPSTVWNESALENVSLAVPRIITLDYPYDVSPVLPAVATLITGFAFALFATPHVLGAAYVAVTGRPVFRLLPQAAVWFAALSSIFLTASAGLVTAMGNLFSGITPGEDMITACTSPQFLGFQWAGAVGMWCIVFLVWLGGVWGQKVVIIGERRWKKKGKIRLND